MRSASVVAPNAAIAAIPVLVCTAHSVLTNFVEYRWSIRFICLQLSTDIIARLCGQVQFVEVSEQRALSPLGPPHEVREARLCLRQPLHHSAQTPEWLYEGRCER